jgi:hypothetical protein
VAFHDRIPKSRAQVTSPVTWVLWALFGNDLDGIYYPDGRPKDAASFWAWWRRNPFHNLFFHVLNTEKLDPDSKDRRLYLRIHPFFFRFRRLGWDIYAGWRPWNGALGFAFRRDHG